MSADTKSDLDLLGTARRMIALVRSKWPDAEAVRILDQHELDAGKPCDRCLLQVLDYKSGEYVDLGIPAAGMTQLVRLARGDLGYDGPIRLAVAA